MEYFYNISNRSISRSILFGNIYVKMFDNISSFTNHVFNLINNNNYITIICWLTILITSFFALLYKRVAARQERKVEYCCIQMDISVYIYSWKNIGKY